MVVHDRDLQELVSSARRWRKDVSDNQSRLIAHTAGVRTLAFRLVQKNVDAVMQFGGEVEAIMNQKLPFHDERDKVQHSVTAMQEVANPVIYELDKLKDEQLLQPG